MQWVVLQDKKYKTQKPDEAFEKARKRVKSSFITTAESQKKELEAAIGILNGGYSLLGEPINDRNDVSKLKGRYDSSMRKDEKQYSSRIAYLNAEVAEKQKEVTGLLNDQKQAEFERVFDRDISNKFAWMPGFGAVGSTVINQKANEANSRYKQAKKEYLQKDENSAILVHLIDVLDILDAQFKVLIDMMKKAIGALGNLQKVFNELIADFSVIVSALDNIPKSSVPGDYDLREVNVEDGIVRAVKKLNEVKQSAKDFLTSH